MTKVYAITSLKGGVGKTTTAGVLAQGLARKFVSEDGRVTGYIEKPTYDFMVSMGIYVFEPRVLEYIPRNAYMDFPDLVKQLIAAGETVTGYSFDGYWQDLGRPDDYERAIEDFDRMKAEFLPPAAPAILSRPVISTNGKSMHAPAALRANPA